YYLFAASPRNPWPSDQLRKPSVINKVVSVRCKRPYAAGKWTLAYHVEDNVVSLALFGEILPLVINDVVCTYRAQHLQFFCAVHGGHLGPEVPGKLDRQGAYASACAIYQHLLS